VEKDTVRHLESNLDVAKETEAKITDKLANFCVEFYGCNRRLEKKDAGTGKVHWQYHDH